MALRKGLPSALNTPLAMSGNLPACKYWQEAATTGGAALNRKKTTGQKESQPSYPPDHLPPILKGPSTGEGDYKEKSLILSRVGNESVCVPGTCLYWILSSWAAPEQVSPTQLLKF